MIMIFYYRIDQIVLECSYNYLYFCKKKLFTYPGRFSWYMPCFMNKKAFEWFFLQGIKKIL